VAGAAAGVRIGWGEGGRGDSEDLVAARVQHGDPQEPDGDEKTPREVAHASGRERATVLIVWETIRQGMLQRIVHLAPLGCGVPAVGLRPRPGPWSSGRGGGPRRPPRAW